MPALNAKTVDMVRPRATILRHHKGDRYVVLHIGTETESQRKQMVYARVDLPNPPIWVRDLEECFGKVGGKPRFKIEKVAPQLGETEGMLAESLHFSSGKLMIESDYVAIGDYRLHYDPMPGMGFEFSVVRIVDADMQMHQWEFVMEGIVQEGEVERIRFCSPFHYNSTMVKPDILCVTEVFKELSRLAAKYG